MSATTTKVALIVDGKPPVALDSDWVAALDRYHHTAADLLDAHHRSGARCSACQQPWPCSAACAAAFALEV
jgi:hypothetical protein